jgi:hypothetical protein
VPGRLVRLGQVIPVRAEPAGGEVYLLSYAQTEPGPQLSLFVRSTRQADPSGPEARILEQFTATDDRGTGYQMMVRDLGGGAEGWTLMLRPSPPYDPRWLDLLTVPGQPAVRVSLDPSVPPHLLGQPVDVLEEPPAQPGLAHPGRAGHQHQPRNLPPGRGVEQLPDGAQLGVPAGQRGLQPVDPLRPAHPGQHPGCPPQMLGFSLALQHMLPRIGEPDGAFRQPPRRPVGQHLPRPRRCPHPRRGVHRVPRDHPLAHGP